jgi:hypothetical protein
MTLHDVARPSLGIWTPYTPTWAATTTQPVVNNGTLIGKYLVVDDLCFIRVALVMGSTTTFGNGTYSWALPSGITIPSDSRQIGSALGLDGGTAWREGASYLDAGATAINITSGGLAAPWTHTIPHTWANTDAIYIQMALEIL